VESLFRIAGAGRTVRPEAGHILAQEGAPPSEVHFLLEGDAVTREEPLPPRQRTAPFAVGLEEVLCGGRLRDTARSREGAVYSVVAAPELLALVSEDSELLRELLRGALADAAGGLRVLRSRPAPPGPAEPASRTLEQIRLLEGSPLFARATPDQLLNLEEVAREETLAQGAVLFGDSEPAALLFIAGGEVSLEGAGEPVVARAGDTLGVLETLAGASVGPARVTVAGRALRLEGDALLERLAEDTGLLQGLFSALREVEAASG
jgi:hypothetical protein